MHRKLLALVLAAIVALGGLSACGGSGSGTTTSPTGDTSTGEATATATTE
jgi:hypothetical protein